MTVEDELIKIFKKHTECAFEIKCKDDKNYMELKVVPLIEVENIEFEIIELINKLEHQLTCRNHQIRVLKKKLKEKEKARYEQL